MSGLGRVQENAVANYPANFVASDRLAWVRNVKEVTVDRGHAAEVAWHMELVVCSPPSIAWWARPICTEYWDVLNARTWTAVNTPNCAPLMVEMLSPFTSVETTGVRVAVVVASATGPASEDARTIVATMSAVATNRRRIGRREALINREPDQLG